VSEADALLVFTPYCPSRLFHLQRLGDMGYAVILIGPREAPAWLESHVDMVLRADLRDPRGFACAAAASAARSNLRIAGVLSLSETGMYFCAQLARALELPFADPERLPGARNKFLMREMFRQHGIPTVPHALVHDLAEARAEARRIGYPVVMKPLIAGAKLFIRTLESEDELDACFDSYVAGGIELVSADPLHEVTYDGGARPSVLIEKRIGGRTLFPTSLDLPVGEVSVEACEHDGEIHLLGMHDKPLPSNGPFFEEVLWSSPTRLPPEYRARVWDAAKRVVEALGIANTIFHVEFRTTDEGPVALEVAARMGGGPVYRSILESSGIDMLDLMVRMATGKPVPREALQPRRQRSVMTFGMFAPEGPLAAIDGIDEVRRNRQVVEVVAYEPVGKYIHRAPRSSHCTVHAMVAGERFEDVEAVGNWAQQTIAFRRSDHENRVY
jgi:biotin carboxylase